MLAASVKAAILSCLATGPGFEAFGDMAGESGFVEAQVRGEDVQWRHADGHEAFVQAIDGAMICSVWTSGPAQARAQMIAFLDDAVQEATGGQVQVQTGRAGPEWDLGGGYVMRLVHQRGDINRIGAAYFAYGFN